MVQTETTEQEYTLEVTEMNKKKLTLKIKNLRHEDASDEDLEYDDSPSSADIKVIHEKDFPPLHGILKQRSVSESSEESSSSGSSPSRSGSKSVSFNSHIDKTTYKPNQAVTSMKQALKSKRKRQRKMDEKKQDKERKRHSSNGSESSSSDERDTKSSNRVKNKEKDGEKEEIQVENVDFEEKQQCIVDNDVIGTSSSVEIVDSEKEKQCSADDNGVIGTSSSVEKVDSEIEKQCFADDNGVIGTSGHKEKFDSASEEANDSGKVIKLAKNVKAKLMATPSPIIDDSDDNIDDEFRTSKCIKEQMVFESNALPKKDVVRTKRTKSDSDEDQNAFDNDLGDVNGSGDVKPTPPHQSAGDTAQSSGKKGRKRRKRKNKNLLTNRDESCSTSSSSTGDKSASESEEIRSVSGSDSEGRKSNNGSFEKKVSAESCSVKSGSKKASDGEGDTDKKIKINAKNEKETERSEHADENGRGKSDVETMLSWVDKNGNSNEHKTVCNVKFSNAVMFDLDVD